MVSTNEVCVESNNVDPLPAKTVEGMAITEDDLDKATKIFQQGKKNLILNKFDEAVNNIGDACKVYSNKYGELSRECADIYYYYGRALLELARVENTVLGNALNGVPEETEPVNDSRYGNPDTLKEEEKEEIAEQVIDAMCEIGKEAEKKEETASEETPAAPMETTPSEGTKEETANTVEPKPVESTSSETVEKKEGEEATEGAEEEEEEGDEEEEEGVEEGEEEDLAKDGEKGADDDDVTNLQQSWEMFELAKLIYTKHYEPKDDEDKFYKQKRIAECLLKLGEIGVEQEVYDQAIGDILQSIRIQEDEIEKEKRDERLLAETYYQLGLTYQFNNQFDQAKESHQKSTNILNLRIEKLKGRLSSETLEDFEKTQINDEIKEIEALLPEMVAKLEEMNEQCQQTLNLIKEAKECFLPSNGNGACATETTDDIKDITGSIKSKRKLSGSGDDFAKKTKVEGAETDAPTNGTTETTEAPSS